MNFEALLEQVLALLRRQGRLSYRALNAASTYPAQRLLFVGIGWGRSPLDSGWLRGVPSPVLSSWLVRGTAATQTVRYGVPNAHAIDGVKS